MNRNIEFVGNKNTNYSSRKGHIPCCIVNHISEGSKNSCISWFTGTRNKKSSTHFLVAKDGSIYQFVDIKYMAWGNGLYLKDIPNAKSSLVKEKKVNPNLYSVSIEHEGIHKETMGELTTAQKEATIWLHEYIIKYVKDKYNYKIPKDRIHILGHCEVDPRRKPFCPGEKFPFDDIIKSLKQRLPFNDIEDHWAKEQIIKLEEKGIINGYQDGSFRPEQYITRGELAAIVSKILCGLE